MGRDVGIAGSCSGVPRQVPDLSEVRVCGCVRADGGRWRPEELNAEQIFDELREAEKLHGRETGIPPVCKRLGAFTTDYSVHGLCKCPIKCHPA